MPEKHPEACPRGGLFCAQDLEVMCRNLYIAAESKTKTMQANTYFPPTLEMNPTLEDAKQYVRGLMFSKYAHHLDDGVMVSLEDSGAPIEILKTLLWNEAILWQNFDAHTIWQEMCPSMEEIDQAHK